MTQHNIGEKVKFAIDFDITKAVLPEGEVEVIVSTPNQDRHGDKINIDGIDTSAINYNAPVMWAHDYESVPLGKILKVWKTAGNLKARVEFALGLNPYSDMIYQMVKQGFIKAVSIGGIVKELGTNKDGTTDFNYIKSMEMIELSFCAIGANPEALVTLKSLESDILKISSEEYTLSAIGDMVKSLQTDVSALASSYEAARVPERQKAVKRTRLVLAKSAAKQIDKRSELVIASINSLLEDTNNGNKNRKRTKTGT